MVSGKVVPDIVPFEAECKSSAHCYLQVIESAGSQIETREYYQTDQIDWMIEKKNWDKL